MRNRSLLVGILLLDALISTLGIDWGLPTARNDQYLFPTGKPWSGEDIYKLAGASRFGDSARGADVDVDPLIRGEQPINLTATPEDVAAIYLRYRLYTHQPDEMITLRALSAMNPREFRFDPRLYQYGGLFIYPVGAFIKACGILGLVNVTSDLVYYLDHPDEFGRFYVIARVYVALWGLLGVLLVYAIAARLAGRAAGLLAALLFALMPVVVCMAHEAKPHLPGAVLMLLAVWSAMKALDTNLDERAHKRSQWLLWLACGAAVGMVISSLPILILIPLAAWFSVRTPPARVGSIAPTAGNVHEQASARRLVMGTVNGLCIAGAVYAITNPYVIINLFINREVLRSNFGNSLAMYEVGRVGEGLIRVLQLTVEGATLPVLVLGLVAALGLFFRRRWDALPLLIPALCVFIQFVLLGAGKPAEYGRFGVFVNSALAIGTACLLGGKFKSGDNPEESRKMGSGGSRLRSAAALMVVLAVLVHGWSYLVNFVLDTKAGNLRDRAAAYLREAELSPGPFAVIVEPAPYCCPPLDFAGSTVWLVPPGTERVAPTDAIWIMTEESWSRVPASVRLGGPFVCGNELFATWTPISWANKAILIGEPE